MLLDGVWVFAPAQTVKPMKATVEYRLDQVKHLGHLQGSRFGDVPHDPEELKRPGFSTMTALFAQYVLLG